MVKIFVTNFLINYKQGYLKFCLDSPKYPQVGPLAGVPGPLAGVTWPELPELVVEEPYPI